MVFLCIEKKLFIIEKLKSLYSKQVLVSQADRK